MLVGRDLLEYVTERYGPTDASHCIYRINGFFIICHLRGLKTCTHGPQARSGVNRGGLDVVSLHRSSGWGLIYILRGHHSSSKIRSDDIIKGELGKDGGG